jgi:hypothetical protein
MGLVLILNDSSSASSGAGTGNAASGCNRCVRLAKGVFVRRLKCEVKWDDLDSLKRVICSACVKRWGAEGQEVLRTSLVACSAIEPEVLRTSLRVYGHWPIVSMLGFSSSHKMAGLSASIKCRINVLRRWPLSTLDWTPGSQCISLHFLSVLLLCHLPILFLPHYMFHLSPPQSAVINTLLMCCLLRYLYSFHLSINTTTLDVLRLAFAI